MLVSLDISFHENCFVNWEFPVVDPREGRGAPPRDQNFLNFMQFLGKFVFWHLPLEGWCPLLRGILHPPLIPFFIKKHTAVPHSLASSYLRTVQTLAHFSIHKKRDYVLDKIRSGMVSLKSNPSAR